MKKFLQSETIQSIDLNQTSITAFGREPLTIHTSNTSMRLRRRQKMRYFNSSSFGKRLLFSLAAAAAFSVNNCWSQVTYTDYSVNWTVYESDGTTLVGGTSSASATVRIGNTVDTSGGSPQVYNQDLVSNPNVLFPSWFQSFSLIVSGIPSGTFTVIKDDLTSLTWANTFSNPSVNPTTFKLSGSEDPTSPAWTLTASGSQPLEMTFTVVGGSSTSYVLKQSGSFSAVPEPEEWAAIASSGLLAFALWHRRSRKAAKA